MKAHTKASMKYNREKCTRFQINFNMETESDVIEWINGFQSKNAYIKSLVLHELDGRNPVYRERSTDDKPASSYLVLSFVNATNASVISRFESVPNKREYICRLVRADMDGNLSESWNQISEYIDLDALLVALGNVSDMVDEAMAKISDVSKKTVLSRLNSQITDTMDEIRSGLQSAEK